MGVSVRDGQVSRRVVGVQRGLTAGAQGRHDPLEAGGAQVAGHDDAGVVADLLGLVRVGLRVDDEQAGAGGGVGAEEGDDRAVAAEDEEGTAFGVVRVGLPERRQGEAAGGGDPGDVAGLEGTDTGGDDRVRGGQARTGVQGDRDVVVGGAEFDGVAAQFQAAQLRALPVIRWFGGSVVRGRVGRCRSGGGRSRTLRWSSGAFLTSAPGGSAGRVTARPVGSPKGPPSSV
jgi:hypothetical protein